MARSVEHLVDMHRLAAERRAAGLPVWSATLRIKQHFTDAEHGPEFEAARDAIVAAVKASGWFRREDEFSRLHEVVDGLADADGAEEFDAWLDELYDLADYDRVWVE
jgi:hypothetical protein